MYEVYVAFIYLEKVYENVCTEGNYGEYYASVKLMNTLLGK